MKSETITGKLSFGRKVQGRKRICNKEPGRSSETESLVILNPAGSSYSGNPPSYGNTRIGVDKVEIDDTSYSTVLEENTILKPL